MASAGRNCPRFLWAATDRARGSNLTQRRLASDAVSSLRFVQRVHACECALPIFRPLSPLMIDIRLTIGPHANIIVRDQLPRDGTAIRRH